MGPTEVGGPDRNSALSLQLPQGFERFSQFFCRTCHRNPFFPNMFYNDRDTFRV
jgi:hypothetical protein